jgi:putative FmdB family regulatory protein
MIYEYSCDKCGKIEVQRKLADPPLETCPTCGEDKIKRLISVTSFVLKGSVWSRDGYSSKIREEIKNQPQAKDED